MEKYAPSKPVNREKELILIARRYYRICYKAHQRISTGIGRTGKVPRTKKEVDRINYEFKFEKQWVKEVEYYNGFKPSEINKAIKDYKKLAMREFSCILK